MAIARYVKQHKQHLPVAEYGGGASKCYRTFTFAADQNSARRSPAQGAKNKAEGMTAGEPDMRFYIEGGKLVLIELKRKGNYLQPVQKKRIALLESLGFTCYTVTATCPADGIEQVMNILKDELRW